MADSNLGVLGLPIPTGDPAAIMNLLIVVCLLWGIVKIPGLMSRYVTRTPPNPMGMILRVVLVQQLTRGLSRAFSGSRSAAGAAGRANRPWPVHSGGGGGGQPRSGGSAPRPLPPPSGAGPGRAGVAHPTGRTVRPYTRDEIAGGVDLYTRTVPRRAAPTIPPSTRPPIRAAGVVPDPPRPGPPRSAPPGVTPATAMPRTRPVRPPVRGSWNRPNHTR